jgi:hypothetical protein
MLALLAFGVSPALASAGCGLMARTDACAQMSASQVAFPHAVEHPDATHHATASDVDAPHHAAGDAGNDHGCNHQHCHLAPSLTVPVGQGATLALPKGDQFAIGRSRPMADRLGSGPDHPPRS